jgi:Domain of unknown function (DUF4148)
MQTTISEPIMNRSISHHAHHTLTRLLAASVLTLASAHLVQAQQPADAQQGSTTTRAANKAELKKLEQNGYQPHANDSNYPQDIQNAEKKASGGTPSAKPAAPGGGQNSQ